ncbi:MAG TPA: TolC family protein [Bryobacteraceae bacterium]|nr:TolC family protein [Bryobacteraceae bacterium]
MFALRRFSTLLPSLVLVTPGLLAQTQATVAPATEKEQAVAIGDLVNELIKNNPDIRAAQYRVDAAMKRPSQMSTLPEPKLTATNFGVGHPFSRLPDSNFAYYSFGFSQEIPYPGKLTLAGEEARKEAESEREMYRTIVLDKISQLKVAYYEWYGIVKAIDITTKNRELLERLERIARARYSVGKGIQQDVLKAQVEQSTLAQQLEVLGQRKATVEARIRSLIVSERPLTRPSGVQLSPLSVTLDEILAALDRQAPRLKARQAILDSRAVNIERSKKEYRPDFGVSVQWQKTGAPFPDYYMATAEVKIPLYFWRKQRLGVEESVARFREARQNYHSERQELMFQVKDYFFTAKTSERLLELYRSGIIPQSSLSLESAMAGYEVGSVDFLTLMNNFMTLLSYEMQYYDELSKHGQAIARLEALVDTPLGRP